MLRPGDADLSTGLKVFAGVCRAEGTPMLAGWLCQSMGSGRKEGGRRGTPIYGKKHGDASSQIRKGGDAFGTTVHVLSQATMYDVIEGTLTKEEMSTTKKKEKTGTLMAGEGTPFTSAISVPSLTDRRPLSSS